MIIIYKETRYAWNCPTCKKWNYMFGNFQHKDNIICKHCSERFTDIADVYDLVLDIQPDIDEKK